MQRILKVGDLKYVLINLLGEGASCSVYKGFCLSDEDKKMLAIKIYKLENKNHLEKEIYINSILPKEYFLSILSYGTGYIYLASTINNDDCDIQNKEEVYFKIEELCENGDLFEYIYNTKMGFPEEISAKIFVNILKLVKILHSKSFVHKDIKPENILIGNDFSLKLIDFGFSQEIDERNNNLIYSMEGTERYCPPETKKGYYKGYDGIKSDIFSLGVLLFVLTGKIFPFYLCSCSDKRYRLIMTKKYDLFWSSFKNYYFSDDFKDLINHLICHNPSDRFDICQIFQHPWIQKNCSDKDLDESCIFNEDVANEFKKRKQLWNSKDSLN